MKVRFFDIKWDDEGHGSDLPESVTLDLDDSFENEEDVSMNGADALSDKFEFCVIGFSFQILDEN